MKMALIYSVYNALAFRAVARAKGRVLIRND